MPAYSDKQLVLEALDDSHPAFGQLVEQYHYRVLRTIASIISDEQAAQDVAQETFLLAWRDLPKLKEKQKFGRWLNKIAISSSKVWLRKQRKYHENAALLEERAAVLEWEQKYQRDRLRQEIWDAIDDLREDYREAVILHYISGYSYKEISEMLSVPVSTVSGRLQKAKAQLRKEFLDMVTKLQLEIDSTVHKFLKERAKQDGVSIEGLVIRLIERYKKDIDSPEIVVRKMRLNVSVMCGSNIFPSPDGRYLSFANGENGNLAILDLTTRESRDLTDEGRWEAAHRHATSSTWSPDSKQIAYSWFNADTPELRIVGLDGSEPRVLHPSEESRSSTSGCNDWSQDGKYILTWLAAPQSIVLIPVDGGSIRTLKSPAPCPAGMTLSPDSRYVAYARPVKEHEDLHDIFVLATDGSGEETRLTNHPAHDRRPVWSPDGKSIVFVSNRTPDGTVGLWLMQVVDGKPAGKPQLIKKEVGDIRTLGFTEKGSLFYATMTSWSDIYIASVDMETGELLSTPELLPSQGFNSTPAWSPDGESLAYESRRSAPGSFRVRLVLVIRSMRTGEEREVIPDEDIATWGTPCQLQWSPDGRSILWLPTWHSLHLIHVQTGHITANVATSSKAEGAISRGAAWSHDGKTIFYKRVRFEKEDWPSRIVGLDLETRVEWELYASGRLDGPLAVSPDGRQLAFRGEEQSLKVIPTAGGEPRTLLRKDPDLRDLDFFGAPMAWTPDGRYVLFMIKKSPSDEQSDGMVQLWRVSAEGGTPKKLLEEEGMSMFYPLDVRPLSLHPDGRRIAFKRGMGKVDLWVMENLLPTFTASR